MLQRWRSKVFAQQETMAPPKRGFIDIHAHVIPAVDDGPETWDESLAMLRAASSEGTATILTTPHGDSRARWESVDSLREGCRRLNEIAMEERIPVSVVLGMENPLSPDLPAKLQEGSAISMNNSAYVLVELPYATLPLYWEEVLFQLQLDGTQPILAHPERQVQIQENPDLLYEPVNRGVLVQLTAGSLSRRFGSEVRKAAETMLRNDLVHIIASDAHAAEGVRGPALREGYAAAARLVGVERATEMVIDNPGLVALGAIPERRPPTPEVES